MVEEEMLRLLSEVGPVTYLDVADLLGIKPTSANERLQRLRRAGVLHISGWQRGSRWHMAIFSIGRAADEPKPAPKDKGQSRKEWEQRKRQEGTWHIYADRYEARKARRIKTDAEAYLNRRMYKQVRYSTDIKKKDPILAALMGVK